MKIAIVQFIPVFGDVNASIAKIEKLLEGVEPGDVDLLLFPELALPGYNFPSLEEIKPFLEVRGEGPSSIWARKTAQRLKCLVSIGYAEKAHPHSSSSSPSSSTTPGKRSPPSGLNIKCNFNSNIIYNPDGEMVGHYRKNFLFMTDMTWCSEAISEGFFLQDLRIGRRDNDNLVRTALGICMDINPYKFAAPFEKFEFSSHVRESGAKLSLVSMAWTSLILTPDMVLGEGKMDPDLETVDYWLSRFKPVIENGSDADSGNETVMVMGNRCGVEGDVVYAGSSMVARVGGGRVQIWDLLGKGEEAVLRVDTEKDPKFVWDAEGKDVVVR